jgi:hypothetical protein
MHESLPHAGTPLSQHLSQTAKTSQENPRQTFPWTIHSLQLLPPQKLPKPGVAHSAALSPSPFPRCGHAMPTIATVNGDLYIFGGLVHGTKRNDLYQLNSRELAAKYVQTSGEIPSPRVGHAAAAIVSSVLMVWGGNTDGDGQSKPIGTWDNGLYLLNLGASAPRCLHKDKANPCLPQSQKNGHVLQYTGLHLQDGMDTLRSSLAPSSSFLGVKLTASPLTTFGPSISTPVRGPSIVTH